MVIKNLLRRKLRTAFSALGVGVGISLMVAIFTISDNLTASIASMFSEYRGDLFIIKAGSEDYNSTIMLHPEGVDLIEKVSGADNIQGVYPAMWASFRTQRPIGPSNQINYYGVTSNSPVIRSFQPVESAKPGAPLLDDHDPNGFICGKILFDLANEQLPENSKLKVGENVPLARLLTGELAEFFLPTEGREFEELSSLEKLSKANKLLADAGVNPAAALSLKDLYLRAVFTSDNRFNEVSLYFHHSITQQLRAMPDQTNFLIVDLKDRSSQAKNRAVETLSERFPELRARRSDQMLDDYPEIGVIKKFGLALSLVAALAGALGVLNTMLISVLERTREIGLLMAIGWSRTKIVGGVVREGLVVTLLGGFAGIGLGYLEVVGVKTIFAMRALTPAISPERAIQAMALALILGFLASLYPAWRASRLTPMDALRQE